MTSEDKTYASIQTCLVEEKREIIPKIVVSKLEKKPWTIGKYRKQTWGVSLHSIGPYVGRMKPSLAHWLVRICSETGDVVLDPFCGIGTVPLEADLLKRHAIGVELNPYALVVAKAKFDRKSLTEQIEWLRQVRLDIDSVDLAAIPNAIKQFYDERTLRELFALKEKIKEASNIFLLACLLAISHGHRPQYLSSVTGYIVPHKKAKNRPVYKPVIPKMIQKVKRMYTSSFPKQTSSEIINGDARKLPLKDETVNVVISSPPYYSTIDYLDSNRLRLAILGVEEQRTLKSELIQHAKSYLENMEKVGLELYRVLKPRALCVFVLGDFPKQKVVVNTAEEISKVFTKIGFSTHGIVADEIPIMKRTVVKWIGTEGLKSYPKKFDRILIMRADK